MASVIYKKDQFLFKEGESVSSICLVLKGSVRILYPEGDYTLLKGDVAGILGLCGTLYRTSCQALEDSTVMVYPISDISSLETFFRDNPDYCNMFLRSAFKQINILLQQLELTEFSCNTLYAGCKQDYALYLSLCEKYRFHARRLASLESVPSLEETGSVEPWMPPYYDGFQNLLSMSGSTSVLAKEAAVPAGLIAEACLTYSRLLYTLQSKEDYRRQLLALYMNESLDDLLDVYTDIYLQLEPGSKDSREVCQIIRSMIAQFETNPGSNSEFYQNRIDDFNSCAAAMQPEEPDGDTPGTAAPDASLQNSLKTILDYAQAEEELSASFKDAVKKYITTGDKNASDDAARALRHVLTTQFYKLYELVFFRAAKEEELPLPVRMFLYFGYVDETLAGAENAAFLAELAERLKREAGGLVYTLFDWLKAIYDGKKEPSRNEFDQDYADHTHSLKVSGKISAAEETALLQDTAKKVEYELVNMVPPVNKMTFGRVSTFCPVFSSHNVLRPLADAFVSSDSVTEILKDISRKDYTVFQKEVLYSNVEAGIQREYFHAEVLPDVVLTPCLGTRGVMWQEIEGKRRNTPARMLLPVFYLDDLKQVLTRLTGEYRWEMCKRIQGARWNDVSERSLTSEYFDYIQFYRKNHELSADVKERLKNALQKARNSFKEMFILDYVTYITYEAAGSPRLTKPARSILFSHCPLDQKCRSTLASNPLYRDILDRYEIKKTQQLHRLDLLEKRLAKEGAAIPEELKKERELLNS